MEMPWMQSTWKSCVVLKRWWVFRKICDLEWSKFYRVQASFHDWKWTVVWLGRNIVKHLMIQKILPSLPTNYYTVVLSLKKKVAFLLWFTSFIFFFSIHALNCIHSRKIEKISYRSTHDRHGTPYKPNHVLTQAHFTMVRSPFIIP